MTRVAIVALSMFVCSCGTRDDAPPAQPELPVQSITRWTGRTELFMEHPALVAGQTARFAVHLTDLATFAPVDTGRVIVRLTGGSGSGSFSTSMPSRPGIFGVDVTPAAAGEYTMQVALEGTRLSDVFDAGSVRVHPDAGQALAAATEEEGDGISYLKEQQWALEFGTAAATERALRDSIPATATIRPRPGADVRVTAPIAGRLVQALSRPLGFPVRAGDELAAIVPRTATAGDRATMELELTQAQNELRLATAERSRAERLVKEGAIPARRIEEATIAEEQAQAAVAAARARLAQVDLVRTGRGSVSDDARYVVRSPISGVIAAAGPAAGSAIEEGTELVRIVGVDTVHVVAQVPETSAGRLARSVGGEIEIPGGEPIPLGRLLSRGRVSDEITRTVPVVFEWPRPDPRFVVGQTVQLRILTDAGSPAVVVPEAAVVDDGGQPVVFVQVSGETFERRTVTTGRREGGLVELLGGVNTGERVVTRGAPLVRLAALSTQAPAHGHVH